MTGRVKAPEEFIVREETADREDVSARLIDDQFKWIRTFFTRYQYRSFFLHRSVWDRPNLSVAGGDDRRLDSGSSSVRPSECECSRQVAVRQERSNQSQLRENKRRVAHREDGGGSKCGGARRMEAQRHRSESSGPLALIRIEHSDWQGRISDQGDHAARELAGDEDGGGGRQATD